MGQSNGESQSNRITRSMTPHSRGREGYHVTVWLERSPPPSQLSVTLPPRPYHRPARLLVEEPFSSIVLQDEGYISSLTTVIWL